MDYSYAILLADDDADNCLLFQEALDELSFSSEFSVVKNGVELRELLTTSSTKPPDVHFLDLNMPLKNGFDCLKEIKLNKSFDNLPIIIFSTSLDTDVVNLFYDSGAHYYIRKPGEFNDLKKVIHDALEITSLYELKQPTKEKFILQP